MDILTKLDNFCNEARRSSGKGLEIEISALNYILKFETNRDLLSAANQMMLKRYKTTDLGLTTGWAKEFEFKSFEFTPQLIQKNCIKIHAKLLTTKDFDTEVEIVLNLNPPIEIISVEIV